MRSGRDEGWIWRRQTPSLILSTPIIFTVPFLLPLGMSFRFSVFCPTHPCLCLKRIFLCYLVVCPREVSHLAHILWVVGLLVQACLPLTYNSFLRGEFCLTGVIILSTIFKHCACTFNSFMEYSTIYQWWVFDVKCRCSRSLCIVLLQSDFLCTQNQMSVRLINASCYFRLVAWVEVEIKRESTQVRTHNGYAQCV